jgi:hypothetical protein
VRASARLTLIAALLGASSATACGDAIEPHSRDDPSRLAAQLDSQYVSLVARAPECGADYYGRRACDMNFVETPAAFGARAAEVEVSIDGAVEKWKGYEVEENHTRDGGESFDSTFYLTAFSGSDLRRYLITYYRPSFPNPEFTTVLFMDDTSEYRNRSGQFYSIGTSSGGTCATPSHLVNPEVNAHTPYACSPALFIASLSVKLFGDPGAPTANVNVSIDSQNFPGVRFMIHDTVVTRRANGMRTNVAVH